jgi:hypothetical protein
MPVTAQVPQRLAGQRVGRDDGVGPFGPLCHPRLRQPARPSGETAERTGPVEAAEHAVEDGGQVLHGRRVEVAQRVAGRGREGVEVVVDRDIDTRAGKPAGQLAGRAVVALTDAGADDRDAPKGLGPYGRVASETGDGALPRDLQALSRPVA